MEGFGTNFFSLAAPSPLLAGFVGVQRGEKILPSPWAVPFAPDVRGIHRSI